MANSCETMNFNFYSSTESSIGIFGKNADPRLIWYGFDENAQFVYGVLYLNPSDEFRIVKYNYLTKDFRMVKCFKEEKFDILGFDGENGVFLIVKNDTPTSLILYNVATDKEMEYNFTSEEDVSQFWDCNTGLACLNTHGREWVLYSSQYLGFHIQRVLFDDEKMCVTFLTHVGFPQDVEERDNWLPNVFVFDKNTIIFMETCSSVMVYNLQNNQISVENFTFEGFADNANKDDWKLAVFNDIGFRNFYFSLHPIGIIKCIRSDSLYPIQFFKLDFPAKIFRAVDISVNWCPSGLMSRVDLAELLAYSNRKRTYLSAPKTGLIALLHTEILTKPVPNADKQNKRDEPENVDENSCEKIVRILCFLPSQWRVTLQDLCFWKIFEVYRKGRKSVNMTDSEFCQKIGIPPTLVQHYISSNL